MEVLERTVEHTRPDIFNIYPVGDCHLGAIHCAENDLQRYIDRIKQDKHGYWIGMGDICDCILKSDKRFDIQGLAEWVKKDNIIEGQRKRVKKMFAPIAHKCLAFLEGNHEDTIHTFYSDDITRNMCDDLKVPYGGESCFIVLKFVRNNSVRQYVIHAWHGAGASQTEGARVMRLMRLVNEMQADIYLMGHLHTVTIYIPDRLGVKSGRITSSPIIAAITGSWLKTYTQPKQGQTMNASYAEKKGYKPSRIGAPVFHLNPDKNWFTVEA